MRLRRHSQERAHKPPSRINVRGIAVTHQTNPTPWAILNPDIMSGVKEFTESSSHRVCALVGGAVVEEALLQSLILRTRTSSIQELMFNPGRPLGDFFAKINLGYLLNMYEANEQSALVGIAEIRNLFAHRLTISSFDGVDEKIATSFTRLKLHEKYKSFPSPFWDGNIEYVIPECKTRREVFTTNVQVLLFLLMRDMRVHLAGTNVPARSGPARYLAPDGFPPSPARRGG